jgi:uncharacterized protein (TIGR03083 family)
MTVITTPDLLRAVDKTAYRVSLLMRSSCHPEANAIGTWNVGETANHLAHCYSSFIGAFEGTFDAAPGDVDRHNAEALAEDPERDLDVLAERVEKEARRYIDMASAFAADQPVDFFTGMRVPASAVTATLLGEALVHGQDIATAEGLPWPIEPEHALLTMHGLVPMLPHFLNASGAAGLRAGYEIRLTGSDSQFWYFDDGTLTVEETEVGPVGCRIAADPATWLLMSYNRIGPTLPTISGKVRVWGRHPWLATRLRGVFKT